MSPCLVDIIITRRGWNGKSPVRGLFCWRWWQRHPVCNHISIKRMASAEVVIRKAINLITVVKILANLASFCVPANYSSLVFSWHSITTLNPFHQSIPIGIIRKTLSRKVIPIAKRCFSVHLKYPFCKIQRNFVICCHFFTPYFRLISCSLVHSRTMNSINATKNVIPVQQNRMYITPENGRPR